MPAELQTRSAADELVQALNLPTHGGMLPLPYIVSMAARKLGVAERDLGESVTAQVEAAHRRLGLAASA